MEHPIEHKPTDTSEPEIEPGIYEYDRLFKRLAGTNILPPNESEWSLEDVEQTMNRVFVSYGDIATYANDGKIYTTLSGGLDSTLALAFLKRNFPESEIITFTMGGTTDHPDILHARIAAEKFATNHHEYIPNPNEISEALEEYRLKSENGDLKQAGKTGDFDVYLLYKYISRFNPKVVIAHDGIDELMGGYWTHRKEMTPTEREISYKECWDALIPNHLTPLTTTGKNFGIGLMFPYVDDEFIKTISKIPLLDRSSLEESKKPLRAIAEWLGVPHEILTRSKRGQVGMLDIK